METKTIKITKDGEELAFENIKEAYDWLACGIDQTLSEAFNVFSRIECYNGNIRCGGNISEEMIEQKILHDDIEDRLNSLVKLLGKMADKYGVAK